jgi:hypothetical protein
MLIALFNILYFSRYIMKERHQEVEILTSQKRKKKARLKTRVNRCPCSHQESKRRQTISVLKKRLNYYQLVQTKLWTSVNILGI